MSRQFDEFRGIKWGIGIAITVWFALMGGLGYIAYHFIHKLW